MTHCTNKKKNPRSNKKKKGANKPGGGVPSDGSTTGNTTRPTQAPGKLVMKEGLRLPDFGHSRRQSEPEKQCGLYDQYKNATQRVKETLQRLCPSALFHDRVHDFVRGADHIAEKALQVPAKLLQDLKTAIRVRQRVAEAFPEGGDEGHAYFVQVLNYCYYMLKPLQDGDGQQARRHMESGQTKKQEGGEEAGLNNRFDILTVEEDEEEDEETDEDNYANIGPVSRPPEPENPYSISHDLVRGSDRFQACIFLDNLDKLMSFNVDQYRLLKAAMRERPKRSHNLPPEVMVQLMKATVTANASMNQARHLEEVLCAENPHISSFYRVIALVLFVKFIAELKAVVLQLSPKKEEFPVHGALEYVSNCLENCFRESSEARDKLTKDFAKEWVVDVNVITLFERMIEEAVMVEGPLLSNQRSQRRRIFDLSTIAQHSWLKELRFIGGTRSIVHTHRLLQLLSDLYDRNMISKRLKFRMKEGPFGRQFDEKEKMATQIAGHLDDFFVAEVMPELLSCCGWGLLSCINEMDEELLPLIPMIRSFLSNKDAPLHVSLTFGLHVLLTSVFELQGNEDVHVLAVAAKNSYFRFIEQVEIQSSKTFPHCPHWNSNLATLRKLRELATVVGEPCTVNSEERALWNPLCAGMFLTYITYFASIRVSSTMLDMSWQLRFLLHLHNALKERHLIQEDIPLVRILDKSFASVRAIWQGCKPKRGEFVKWWWVSFGVKPLIAKQEHERARESYNMGYTVTRADMLEGFTFRLHATPIEADDFSRSFRRVCLRDFSELQDQRRDTRSPVVLDSSVNEHLDRVKDSLEAISGEADLLSLNLVSVSFVVNDFVYFMSERMGWDAVIDSMGESSAKLVDDDDPNLKTKKIIRRGAACRFLSHEILRLLDFCDDLDGTPEAKRAAQLLVDYFSRIPLSELSFYKLVLF